MKEESRLIKLMANFPACDLREAYFQRWKEIFSEAIESDKELTALRAWKAKARPFLPLAQCKILDSMMRARVGGENVYLDALQENLNELTELLGGSDDITKAS